MTERVSCVSRVPPRWAAPEVGTWYSSRGMLKVSVIVVVVVYAMISLSVGGGGGKRNAQRVAWSWKTVKTNLYGRI